jgi:hypothetical protein
MSQGKIYLTNQFGEDSINTLTALGGANGPQIQFTSGCQIFSGTGAPTLTGVAPGSLYLRADGANNNQVLYVSFDGSTWNALVHA